MDKSTINSKYEIFEDEKGYYCLYPYIRKIPLNSGGYSEHTYYKKTYFKSRKFDELLLNHDFVEMIKKCNELRRDKHVDEVNKLRNQMLEIATTILPTLDKKQLYQFIYRQTTKRIN